MRTTPLLSAADTAWLQNDRSCNKLVYKITPRTDRPTITHSTIRMIVIGVLCFPFQLSGGLL